MEMPEAVVDILEAVEVEEEEGEPLLGVSLRAGESVPQTIHKHRAVGKAGQWVLETGGTNGFA